MKTSGLYLVVLPAIVASTLILPLAGGSDALAAPGGKGKPGSGSGDSGTQILPQSLGTSTDCTSSDGRGINNDVGFGLYAAAQGLYCAPEGAPTALRWSQADGAQNLGTLPGSNGSSAEDVSDDGTVVGFTAGNGVGLPFVFPLGSSSITALPMISGMRWGAADGISPDGRFIVGTNSTETANLPVRWTRVGQSWDPVALNVTYLAIPFGVRGVSNDGTALVNRSVPNGSSGTRVDIAGYWADGSTSWIALPGYDTRAFGISVAGDWIVGQRLAPCSSSCDRYPVPVYWKKRNSDWLGPFDLPALDNVDSRAYAIAQRNGRRLIVGYGYTNKDAIMRAVYWLEQPDGSFALNRLAALDGRSRAWSLARDVNSAGQITGSSAGKGFDQYAVLWTLP